MNIKNVNEYEVIKVCLKANLEIIEMCQESNHEKKNLLLLTVISELKNMCETIIPIFENRVEKKLKN